MPAKIIAIVGPTAAGKSALALHLAREINGEIISADSRQVYRFMDIGTAKPSPAERAEIPHHLIDAVNPDQPFSLADFQALCIESVRSIQSRNHLPILAGGTGQYIWSVLENWDIPRVAPDLTLRQRFERTIEQSGVDELYKELASINPEIAARTDRLNPRRVIRALEISYHGGPGPAKRPGLFKELIIGLTAPRPALYCLTDARVDNMVVNGLAEETKRLVDMGYSTELPSMSGIGYRQMVRYLKGEIDLAAAISSIKVDTHRLVRQQYNWFKITDRRIRWFDITGEAYVPIKELVDNFRAEIP